MSILALDLATASGAAWHGEDGEIYTRTIDLRDIAGIVHSHAPREHAKLFAALFRVIGDQKSDQDLHGRITTISVEDDTGLNEKTSALLAGYRAVVALKCQLLGLRYVDALDASEARATAGVGGGSTDKETAIWNARRYYGLEGGPDEVDAAILLIATEHWIAAEPVRLANAKQAKKIKAHIRKSAADKTGTATPRPSSTVDPESAADADTTPTGATP
jgi:hypothetical protein